MKYGNAFKDKTGQRFGKLVVVKVVNKNIGGNYLWLCQCDCGKKKIIVGGSLKSGGSKSCGCSQFGNHWTHKMSKTRFYTIFGGINARCNNPKNPAYNRYGGRGIKCLWESFKEFKNDMYESYLNHVKLFGEKETTIDRINNDAGYSKENCRWATYKEQARNTRRNITFKGQTKGLSEWSEIYKINPPAIWARINKLNWSVEKAFTTPIQSR